jgi:hypothetical protein
MFADGKAGFIGKLSDMGYSQNKDSTQYYEKRDDNGRLLSLIDVNNGDVYNIENGKYRMKGNVSEVGIQ